MADGRSTACRHRQFPMSHDMRSAAILAGGKASRFGGRDKSALLVDGRTILERQIAELRSAAADVMVIGGQRENIRRSDAVTDRVPGCGPLGGLHAALAAAHGDHVVVVACDMPFVTASLISHLLSLAPRRGRRRSRRPNAAIIRCAPCTRARAWAGRRPTGRTPAADDRDPGRRSRAARDGRRDRRVRATGVVCLPT